MARKSVQSIEIELKERALNLKNGGCYEGRLANRLCIIKLLYLFSTELIMFYIGCLTRSVSPRSTYNTTAPMYGVSLTSGQPVTIVQKFPDLLQQVIYETCE